MAVPTGRLQRRPRSGRRLASRRGGVPEAADSDAGAACTSVPWSTHRSCCSGRPGAPWVGAVSVDLWRSGSWEEHAGTRGAGVRAHNPPGRQGHALLLGPLLPADGRGAPQGRFPVRARGDRRRCAGRGPGSPCGTALRGRGRGRGRKGRRRARAACPGHGGAAAPRVGLGGGVGGGPSRRSAGRRARGHAAPGALRGPLRARCQARARGLADAAGYGGLRGPRCCCRTLAARRSGDGGRRPERRCSDLQAGGL
mmetsp:Transcript_106171/g.327684  ORF Transcript_106171/g.327684 Transcript_106171/m.327684 type:complete len:254 (+) Transcript_106171:391-1152(+)